jgi:hypothetical protein
MPIPDIKEEPTRSYTPGLKTFRAVRNFTAAWFSDEEAVRAALATTPWNVDIGSPYPLNRYMVCLTPDIKQKSPNFWTIQATYDYNGSTGGATGNPLNLAPKIYFDQGVSARQSGVDDFGNGIQNSALNPFAGGIANSDPTLFLIIERNEPIYDVTRDLAYSGYVNSAPFSPGNLFTLEPGQCRCESIRPTSAYFINAPFIPIIYRFELRAGKAKDNGGLWDGFRERILDQGRWGWINPGGMGTKPSPIMAKDLGTGQYREVSEDVLLDGLGKPLVAGYVGMNGEALVNAPIPLPANVVIEVDQFGVHLKYRGFKVKSFAGIGI